MEKATEEEIKTDVLPMIFNALESNSIQSQVKNAHIDIQTN